MELKAVNITTCLIRFRYLFRDRGEKSSRFHKRRNLKPKCFILSRDKSTQFFFTVKKNKNKLCTSLIREVLQYAGTPPPSSSLWCRQIWAVASLFTIFFWATVSQSSTALPVNNVHTVTCSSHMSLQKKEKTPHTERLPPIYTRFPLCFSHSVHTGVPLTLQAACLGSLIMLHD